MQTALEAHEHADRTGGDLAPNGHAVGLGLGDLGQQGPPVAPVDLGQGGDGQRSAADLGHGADQRELAVQVDEVSHQLEDAHPGGAHTPGDAQQLVGRGRQARRRPPVARTVVDRPGGREAEGPGPDPVGRQPAHRLDLVGRRDLGVLGAPVAHHVAPQCAVRDLRGHVHGVGQSVEHVEVLREALPPPADALGQRRARDVLHALHQGDQPVVTVGLHRREPDATVAHDHGRDALPRGRGQQRVPGDLTVVVGVDVDPAGRDQQPRRRPAPPGPHRRRRRRR